MPFSDSIGQDSRKGDSIVLIGAGRMGRHHLDALGRTQVWCLAGVFDRHLGQTPHSDSDLARWLERLQPSAAIVAVPPDAHDPVARTCLSAGCHVLLEKPICPTSAGARSLAAEFRSSGKVLFGGHTERFHPVFLALCRNLEKVGTLLDIEAWRVGPAPTRIDAGGVVLDLAVHDLDLLRRLVGMPLECVAANGRQNPTCPEDVFAELRWNSGAARVVSRWCEPRRRTLTVVGTQGVLEADLLGRSLRFLSDGGDVHFDILWADPLEAEQTAFAAACRGEFESVLDLEPQIQAVELAEAILRAIS